MAVAAVAAVATGDAAGVAEGVAAGKIADGMDPVAAGAAELAGTSCASRERLRARRTKRAGMGFTEEKDEG